jgi:hypothetical protein
LDTLGEQDEIFTWGPQRVPKIGPTTDTEAVNHGLRKALFRRGSVDLSAVGEQLFKCPSNLVVKGLRQPPDLSLNLDLQHFTDQNEW